MSDAIMDGERSTERARLTELDPDVLAYKLKQALSLAEKQVRDLRRLGYTVEIDGFKVRIYKEIGL